MAKADKTGETPLVNDDLTPVREIARILDSKKGDDIKIYDMRPVGGYIGVHLVATALSDLHIKNLTGESEDKAREYGMKTFFPNPANFESGWVILDFGSPREKGIL